MSLPQPEPGLVIRYAYLWRTDFLAGREDGLKDRPCAIVTAVTDNAGKKWVLVIPVTHTPPPNEETAIEIPAEIKQHLGLDTDRSWIVFSESNYFQWPGPDLRLASGSKGIAYGFLPRGFFKKIQERFVAYERRHHATRVKRSQ